MISDRISIQGRVHQHLYEQGDLHRIEFGAFLTELCQSIMASLSARCQRRRSFDNLGEVKFPSCRGGDQPVGDRSSVFLAVDRGVGGGGERAA